MFLFTLITAKGWYVISQILAKRVFLLALDVGGGVGAVGEGFVIMQEQFGWGRFSRLNETLTLLYSRHKDVGFTTLSVSNCCNGRPYSWLDQKEHK